MRTTGKILDENETLLFEISIHLTELRPVGHRLGSWHGSLDLGDNRFPDPFAEKMKLMLEDGRCGEIFITKHDPSQGLALFQGSGPLG